MLRYFRRIALRQARGLVLSQTIALAVAVSTAGAARPLSLETVRGRLAQQRERIESLHLRIRRETTLSVDPKVLLSWPSRPALPKYLGTDEVRLAIKGDKRYVRALELDYQPPLTGSPAQASSGRRRYLDEAKAWTGEFLLERKRNLQAGRFVYRSVTAEKARDCFPPPSYLRSVGLAVPDPTGKDEARRSLRQMGLLPELLKRWPYKVFKQSEEIDGAAGTSTAASSRIMQLQEVGQASATSLIGLSAAVSPRRRHRPQFGGILSRTGRCNRREF